MSLSLAQVIYGIGQVETGGVKGDRYKVVNGIGAVGKYQVMQGNVPSWTKEALGRSMTWQQFRNDPSAQEAVARYKIGQSFAKYGPEGAAAVWFSGQPNPNSKASDGGNTVREYVDKVIKWATGSKGTGSTQQASASAGLPSIRSVVTAQQAGYQAEARTGPYGAPVNPYKLPGWIASQSSASTSSTGTTQADWTDDLPGVGGGLVPWDGVSTVVLTTLFVLGGIGLVVVGLVQSVSPAVKQAATTAASLTPEGAAVGAAKGAVL